MEFRSYRTIEVAKRLGVSLQTVQRWVDSGLITDVDMPHMDGFEMLRSLAESTSTSPSTIVAVSSLSPSDLAARGRLLPGVHFLSKPVDRERLGILLGAASPAKSTPVAKA